MRKRTAIADGRAAVTHSLSLALQVAMAAALGLVLVWGVGFAPMSKLHNAAHDTRHSDAFPCH